MYYSKEEIKSEILNCHKEAMESKLKPLVSLEEAFKKLEDEEEIVGYFWLTTDDKSDIGLKMSSRMYLRIEHNLYTDDRFAIDMYEAQVEGKTVGEIVRERKRHLEEKEKNVNIKELKESGFKEKLIGKLKDREND